MVVVVILFWRRKLLAETADSSGANAGSGGGEAPPPEPVPVRCGVFLAQLGLCFGMVLAITFVISFDRGESRRRCRQSGRWRDRVAIGVHNGNDRIPRRFASWIAMASRRMSITNIAAGARSIFTMPSRLRCSLFCSRRRDATSSWADVRLRRLEEPSISCIRLTLLRMVRRFVKVPPSQRSTTYGILVRRAASFDFLLRLLLGADEQNGTPVEHDLVEKTAGDFHLVRVIEVDNVNPVTRGENELFILGFHRLVW